MSVTFRRKDLEVCCCRPVDLSDMTIKIGGGRGGGGGRNNSNGKFNNNNNGGGGQWGHAALPNVKGNKNARHHNNNNDKGGDQWSRGRVSVFYSFYMVIFILYRIDSFPTITLSHIYE